MALDEFTCACACSWSSLSSIGGGAARASQQGIPRFAAEGCRRCRSASKSLLSRWLLLLLLLLLLCIESSGVFAASRCAWSQRGSAGGARVAAVCEVPSACTWRACALR
jgi:hypothetical protein